MLFMTDKLPVKKPRTSKEDLAMFGPIGTKISSGGADSILARLFRKIIVENGYTIEKVNVLMEQYLSDKRNAIPQNTKDRSSARGNLRKELFKPGMSWKVFCKALRFLNIRKFDINLDVFHADGAKSKHGESIDLGDPVFSDYVDIDSLSQVEQTFLDENLNKLIRDDKLALLEQDPTTLKTGEAINATLDTYKQRNQKFSRFPLQIKGE